MILTNKTQFKRYEVLHPAFAKVAECLKTMDFQALELGRIVIDGDNLFINNVLAKAVKQEDQPMELHRDYIDIHVLISGKERIAYKAIEQISAFSQEYKKDGDCALTKDAPTAFVDLVPGDMCIVYPEDAHAPLIGEGEIRKLIVKVKL